MEMTAEVLPLRQMPESAATLIAAAGLTDEQIAAQLSEELPMPVRPSLVGKWRLGQLPEPDVMVLDLLAAIILPCLYVVSVPFAS